MTSQKQLPREITDGLFWLGECLVAHFNKKVVHSHVSSYLIKGSEKSILVDTGHPKDWDVIGRDLDNLLQGNKLDYIFPTHSEVPHAGNLQRLIDKFPNAKVVGDLRDYHLFFPECRDSFMPQRAGDRLDLGDTQFIFLDAVMRDLPHSMWGYDTKRQALFCSDGLSYSHQHMKGECALTSEELPVLPTTEELLIIAKQTFYWAKYIGLTNHYSSFEKLIQKYPVKIIAPAHGSVITNPEAVLPMIKESFLKDWEEVKNIV